VILGEDLVVALGLRMLFQGIIETEFAKSMEWNSALVRNAICGEGRCKGLGGEKGVVLSWLE